jgi:Ser/Thr protein kinase RdoA (MazF antagonist)
MTLASSLVDPRTSPTTIDVKTHRSATYGAAVSSHLRAWPGLELGERLGGGHRNEVWSARLDDERVAVRRSRRSPDSLRWELTLLSLLSELGFGIAEAVPAADGAHEVDGVVVQRWVEGRPPTDPADWRQVAGELQRLHRVTGHIAQRPGCCTVTQLRRQMRSVDADVSLLPVDVRDLVLAVFEQFGDAPVSVVHGDPGASNIRLDESGRVWFLDWDESRVDVCWLDLADLGVVVLDDEAHRRATALSHAWESINAWSAEPEYAARRLAALRVAG